jgi:outer membrane biosynthesis protein TonB
MIAKWGRIREISVFRCLAAVVGFALIFTLVMAAAGAARAQTNIDQGKPASELFANYCAVCHKSTRGLANGRSSLTLSLFLREHYASSREQAAALAAYVIGAGGNAPAPMTKPERARVEEPKGQEPKGQEAKSQEAKGQETKGQETKGQETKGQETKGQEPKPQGHEAKSHPTSASAKSEPEKPGRAHEEAAPGEQETAPVAAAPSTNPAPNSAEPGIPEVTPTTSAGISSESPSNENAPVPRDNIPD